MIKLYGSDKCEKCQDLKGILDSNKINYEYIDITDSIKNLKEFIYLRDANPQIFNEAKKYKGIGIPAIITEDNKIILDWRKYLATLLS